MNAFTAEPFTAERCPVADLASGEQLLLASFRRVVWAECGAAGVRRSLRGKLGTEASHRALGGLLALIGLLSENARRRLRFRFPHCARVSADERTLIVLVAAAQAGETTRARAILSMLLPAGGQELGLSFAVSVAEGLREGGVRLTAPNGRRPPEFREPQSLRAVI